MTITTTVIFFYSLSPVHCLSRHDFSPLVTQPSYFPFLSSCADICISQSYISYEPIALFSRARKRKCQNSWGRFWGWVKKGHRHCRGSEKSRGVCAVSLQSDAFIMCKATKLTASQEAGESVTLNATSLCHFLLLKSVLFIAIFILSALSSTLVPV